MSRLKILIPPFMLLLLAGCNGLLQPQDVQMLKTTVDEFQASVADWQVTAQGLYDPCELAKINPATDRIEDRLADVSTLLNDMGTMDPNDAAMIVDAAIAAVTAAGTSGLPYAGIILAALFGVRAVVRGKQQSGKARPPPATAQ